MKRLSMPDKFIRDAATPMRVVSQQHTATHRLFDQLLAGDNRSSSESSSNAIEKLNLLEEDGKEDYDDESEWNEPPKTVFDRDAQEECKNVNLLIQQAEEIND